MYTYEIKERAIQIFEEQFLDSQAALTNIARDVSAVLKSELGYDGSAQTVFLWLKDPDRVRERISNTKENIVDLEEELGFEVLNDIQLKDLSEVDIIKHYIRLRKKSQLQADKARIMRKVFREQDRVGGVTEALLEEILDKQDQFKPAPYKPTSKVKDSVCERTAIIQITDTHLNESVFLKDTKGANEYNFKIASKRLMKYRHQITPILAMYNITKIIVAFTGDIYNSNRRMDEIIRNQEALADGFLIGASIISRFLLDLATKFEIEVVTVFGNESRLDDELLAVNFHNNFDYLLHHYLGGVLSQQRNIYFHPTCPDHELLTNILGASILFWHGHNRGVTPQKLITKYNKKGKLVNYIIQGHLHNMQLSDTVGLSGSLSGDNAYNFHQLSVVSRASQNIYIVEKEAGIDLPSIRPIPIDLQYTGNYDGYPVPEDANEASFRSAAKKGMPTTILKVVI